MERKIRETDFMEKKIMEQKFGKLILWKKNGYRRCMRLDDVDDAG